ncbi:hypothetical protein [Chryseobacterium sp. HSC-36S06]|uniref:hypothetical protein n=1 Tax=Chryseobacterium sp. HSC-36S06 TaxID=2910970 RepID=UPI0020A02527|nr:hypothetical protein [Chryseobacterium sp. HSC-36S06]MCP2037827.1 hypothetical protein [Chryseobacterium sp. HSC-36S06]
MKRFIAFFVLMALAACTTQKKYTDFDYSYSRSGGLSPIYENLWIKGNNAHYSFEGQGKNIKKDFTLSKDELSNIQNVLEQNNFRMIQEDYKKLYDYISTSIIVKKGSQSASKSDASYIMEADKSRWENVENTFRKLIDSKTSEAK